MTTPRSHRFMTPCAARLLACLALLALPLSAGCSKKAADPAVGGMSAGAAETTRWTGALADADKDALERSLDELDDALEAAPDDGAKCNARGVVLAKLGRLDDAVSDLRAAQNKRATAFGGRAAAVGGWQSAAVHNLALVDLLERKAADALTVLGPAAERGADSGMALNAGLAAFFAGDDAAARTHFGACLSRGGDAQLKGLLSAGLAREDGTKLRTVVDAAYEAQSRDVPAVEPPSAAAPLSLLLSWQG